MEKSASKKLTRIGLLNIYERANISSLTTSTQAQKKLELSIYL